LKTEVEIHNEHAIADMRQVDEDIRTVLATPAGRRLLMAAVNKAGIYRKTGVQELARANYEAGRRDAGLDLLTVCNVQARALVELAQKERTETMERRASELDAARKARR